MAPEIAQRQRDRGKGCLLKEQSREHAWHVPRLYQPSIITCGRRYTRVCKVRVAQGVYKAQSGPESQTSIEQAPNFVLGCEAPSVPGAFGVYSTRNPIKGFERY